ncbi:AAA family ATPase [Candidatus Venteria ishoeyi]|uniref:ATPase AAA-type core domain-containing protein n=1 Tax=Candidatus Venteria ishoeyi TaxID=1899563 RepID=A0A1H6FD82_9GAMM|nr:ATP-binding protein [Candidatus Venteria ishoeyi]SEH07279.1 Uncharacterised protein [Candidatus Venteria ishoeyi]
MHIKSLHVNNYKILSDLKIEFSAPEDRKNVVNVIAGVNGCGKTSLLQGIFELDKKILLEFNDFYKKNEIDFQEDVKICLEYGWRLISSLESKIQNETNIFDAPRIIFMPSQLNFDYQTTHKIDTTYKFTTLINGNILGDAEFYIKEYILAKERESHIADPEQRKQAAIDSFNKHFKNTRLLTQLHDLDKNQYNRPVFQNIKGDLLTIEQLSDGEKQLYGRVVALMMLRPQNSIILIDEPELALHPAWQQEIMTIYSNIGKNNQFIVATHSPQIIANTAHKNLILLTKKDNKIIAIPRSQPPVAVDVNAILAEVMGAAIRPQAVEQLYKQYRELVDKQQEDTEQGQKLKQAILDYESPNSAFMQEMDLIKSLRSLS